jgi:hypothetical protein
MTTPAPTPEDIKAQYGFVAMLAQAVPEIGKLMQQAVSQKWTAERFQMAVAATSWWKRTPAPTRQWITQNVADPASAARTMKTGGDEVSVMASKFGYSGIPQSTYERIWLEGQLAGYDDAMMQQWTWNALYKYGRANGQVPTGGEFGARLQQGRELAMAYGYTPEDLDGQVAAAMGTAMSAGQTGDAGMADWMNKLKNYAKSKYAPFADRLDAGETVRDIAQPYIDMYSQTLEVNPQDVGLDDKYIQRWLQGKSEAGKPPASTAVWQAQEDLRKDTRWGFTQNARQSAAEAATVIGKSFGMIG